jgi:hypothetical protein
MQAMSTRLGEQSEVLTLTTLRLQLRFVPDKKADVGRPRKNRRIPGIFSSVAQSAQSVKRRNDKSVWRRQEQNEEVA